jgi:GNAT superfamily N-acetyltransferase
MSGRHDVAFVEHAPWYRTAPAALLIHIKPPVQRLLADGFVLDDDPDRIDRTAVHAFLSGSYWALGRERELMDELIATAARVVGLYGPDGDQLGFARVVSDLHTVSYLADVYVLEEVRGRGFGLELVRFTVDGGMLGPTKWILHTRDMHRLYAKLGFVTPGERAMERCRSPAPGEDQSS